MVKPKRTSRGSLIVFEGVDGVGKTTSSKRLAAHLNRRGVNTRWYSFPGHETGTLGAEIYRIHHARWARKLNPVSTQLLHVAAHIELIHKKILPALARGEWVVLDRYWWSTQVYGTAAGADRRALAMTIALEQRAWGSVRPSLALLILRGPKTASSAECVRLYQKLAALQAVRHPVRILKNNSSLDDLFQQILLSPNLADILRS